MKNLPQMISTKDAAYIKDMFNWNMVAAKKIEFYLESVEDEQINKEFNELVVMHMDFCGELIKLLESGENND